MKHLTVGIRLESLVLPLRRALAEASRLGVSGVQVDAVGELSPAALSETGRREFRHLLRGYNLELTALGCPLRRSLDDALDQQQRLDHVREVLSLSIDLGPGITMVQSGSVPDESDNSRRALLHEALLALGQYGDRIGARLALATGSESGSTLASFLQGLDTGSLGVNLDPASLQEHGFDPCNSVMALQGRILHSHARDVRRCASSQDTREVPLGQGDIDWVRYLGVLEEVQYRGWITVVREAGDNRRSDVAEGVAFLRRLEGVATSAR